MDELLGRSLLDAGVLNEEQLNAALGRQRRFGGRLASICLHLGYADERSLAITLSRVDGLPYAVLSESAIDVAMTQELPQGVASKLQVLPLHRDTSSLYVAMANPRDVGVLDELRFGTGARIVEYGALSQPLLNAISRLYALGADPQQKLWVGQSVADADQVEQAHIEVVRGDEPLPQPVESLAASVQTPIEQLLDASQAKLLPLPDVGGDDVLVVDDDQTLRLMLVDFVTRLGLPVRQAADGQAAISALQQALPRVVLLDAMLPGIHGFDICKQIKGAASTRHIGVIMISAIYRGWRFADDVKRLYGADAFIEKPFRLDELKRAMDQLDPASAPDSAVSEHARQLLEQASQAYRAGDPAAALRVLEHAVTLAPLSGELYQRLGALYQQQNMSHRALAAYERAVELLPSYEHVLSLARLYEQSGFAHKAFEAWERAFWLATKPEEAEVIRRHIYDLLPQRLRSEKERVGSGSGDSSA